MEHAEALERIEIAAAEPDGLDRLMAGDTTDAAAVAGHLAGCASCAGELARIRRTVSVARDVIRSQPDPELRARTLAYVKTTGVPRGPAADVGAGVAAATPGPVADAGPAVSPLPATSEPVSIESARSRRRLPRLGWIAAAAAVVVVALGAGYMFGAPSRDRLDGTQRQVALLQDTAQATLRIAAQPDATRVVLAPTPQAPGADGTLLFSPTSGELVMVATGLAPTGPGQEYGCWVDVGGTRTWIGRMFWAGDLWTWAGPVDGLASVPAGAVFGVSVGAAGGGPYSVPVLTGEL